MNNVNFKKVVFGVSLGTVMALGSMSSAFAADINHPTAQSKTVQQQKQVKTVPQPKQVKTVPQPKQVTQSQVKDIALKQYKGTVKDIKLNKENGKDVYAVVVHGQDGKDHTLKVDASTGVTVSFTQEQIKAIALQQYPGTVKSINLSNENGVDVYVVIINGQDGKEHTVKIDAATGVIVPFTQAEVTDIALKQYKGTVKDIKLNKENGKDVYAVVVHGQDGKDHDVKIDAATGVTVSYTQEQIKAIALQQYPGTVKDIKLSNENGIDVYVVIINGQDGKEHTVKIDAATGVIVPFTQTEVKDIALKQYQGTVKDIKLNKENGKDVYTIVVHGQDGKDHDVRIDAQTGENC
jgi:uncharacterized membrane protein YkoI